MTTIEERARQVERQVERWRIAWQEQRFVTGRAWWEGFRSRRAPEPPKRAIDIGRALALMVDATRYGRIAVDDAVAAMEAMLHGVSPTVSGADFLGVEELGPQKLRNGGLFLSSDWLEGFRAGRLAAEECAPEPPAPAPCIPDASGRRCAEHTYPLYPGGYCLANALHQRGTEEGADRG